MNNIIYLFSVNHNTMGKTRNGHLVKNQYVEDEFCLDDYPYQKVKDFNFWEQKDYEEIYSIDKADAEYTMLKTDIAKKSAQVQPKAWDGIMRKDEKRFTKTYKSVPSLCTLAVDALPMRIRAELPKYFPGSLDYLNDK
jgi:prenyltransferase beta subunit